MNWVVRIADDAQLFIENLPDKGAPASVRARRRLARLSCLTLSFRPGVEKSQGVSEFRRR